MVYLSRDSDTEHPAIIEARENEKAKRHRVHIDKLANFLRSSLLATSVNTEQGGTEGRSEVAKVFCQEGSLTVQHRGHTIKVETSNPQALEAEFRAHCAANAKHITVQPRVAKCRSS